MNRLAGRSGAHGPHTGGLTVICGETGRLHVTGKHRSARAAGGTTRTQVEHTVTASRTVAQDVYDIVHCIQSMIRPYRSDD